MWNVWGREGVHVDFCCKTPRKSAHLVDPGVKRNIIFKRILNKQDALVDRIDMQQDRDYGQALVSAVMNLCVPSKGGNFLTS